MFHRQRVSSSACCKAGNGCSACVSFAFCEFNLHSACFMVCVFHRQRVAKPGMAVLRALNLHYVCFINSLRVSSSACFIVIVLQRGEWLFCVHFIGFLCVSFVFCVFHRLRVSSLAFCKYGNGCSACVSFVL